VHAAGLIGANEEKSSMAVPTKAQWQAQTSSAVRTRGGHNPELLDIDNLLDLYQGGDDWIGAVSPLIKILTKIGAWEVRRNNQESARRPAFRQLRRNVEDRLAELVAVVFQCEHRIVSGNAAPRYLITCGVLSCIVVMVYDPVSKSAGMAHLQQKNTAEGSIAIMVRAWQEELDAWAPDRVVVTLAGGREMNADKLAQLETALGSKKFNASALKKHDVLRPNDSLAINVALDRNTGNSFVFPDNVDVVPWRLRSKSTSDRLLAMTNAKVPVLQTYDGQG
jgi:hypothetical protein